MQLTDYFKFDTYTIDLSKGEAAFSYELKYADKTYNFTEKLTFIPPTDKKISSDSARILDEIGKSLHLILGISYWKTYCPKMIVLPFTLTEKQAAFWNLFYTKGLGEFFYENKIDYRDLVQFPYVQETKNQKRNIDQQDRSLVMIGGGKDSIVSAELMKSGGFDFSLFALNTYAMHGPIVEQIGKPIVRMTRIIDKQLIELNKEGAYNGHVPISAIYAFTSLLSAFLYDYKYIVVSNEESANYGNVLYLGAEINHQWSKSLEFEKRFQEYIDEFVVSGITYFSLLRPFREIKIVELFTHMSKYFPLFSSCNRNFAMTNTRKEAFWCGACAKCAFIFLLLAAFLEKEKVLSIFHKNLFEDVSLLQTYKQILGIEGVKPFDCVGTPEESLYALSRIIGRKEYADDTVIVELSKLIGSQITPINKNGEKLLQALSSDTVPEVFRSLINL